tara:strand:+ start:45 stop:515 length:471 start_codon:yes stop_codon:yes gene_type:complete
MAVHKIDGVNGVVNYPKKFVTLWADGAITKGDVVCFSSSTTYGIGLSVTITDGSVAIADDSQRAVGIAVETVTTGKPVKVQVAGYNNMSTAAANIDIWDPVGHDTGVDGRIQTIGGTADGTVAFTTKVKPIGICIDAFTSGNADGAIMIYDHGMFG